MATIISLINQKGGVGKTTSTINLAYALVKRGKKVLMVDADPQASLTRYVGHDPVALDRDEKTLLHAVLVAAPLPELIVETPIGADLLGSSINLASVEPRLSDYGNTILGQRLDLVRDNYDFILIDCPPTLTILTISAMAAADLLLVPVKTDFLSILGIPLLLESYERIRTRANPQLGLLGILPTLFNTRSGHDQEALKELQDVAQRKGIRVFEPVRRSTAFDRSASEGRPTLATPSKAPRVEVYQSLADEIIGL